MSVLSTLELILKEMMSFNCFSLVRYVALINLSIESLLTYHIEWCLLSAYRTKLMKIIMQVISIIPRTATQEILCITQKMALQSVKPGEGQYN